MANQDNNKKTPEVSVDVSSLLEATPELEVPKQVEPVTVIYVPRKDFEARVNQDIFYFRTGVPTKVTRDVAAMLTEDPDRGYVRD